MAGASLVHNFKKLRSLSKRHGDGDDAEDNSIVPFLFLEKEIIGFAKVTYGVYAAGVGIHDYSRYANGRRLFCPITLSFLNSNTFSILLNYKML